RNKGIGTYEFPPTEETDHKTQYGSSICFSDISSAGASVYMGLYYKKDKQLLKASFIVEKTAAFDSFIKAIRSARSKQGEADIFANAVYCTELYDNWGLDQRSVLAQQILFNYGERNLESPKDMVMERNAYLLKAMAIHFLRGSLYLVPHVLVGKTTQNGKDSKYTFYFSTDEFIPLNITVRITPKSTNEYLDILAGDSAERCRYLL
ncbi:hypothetical protein IKG13_04205, partial [Candidatus Saccharibacteria bacterium]|nr:hypothetical protein [Candidatus Saccharibacteria bacterium]